MKLAAAAAVLLFASAPLRAHAADSISTDVLATLASNRLPPSISLGRSNAVRIVLESFRSNDTVKAIVVAPGVVDDFYLVHRDAAPLRIEATNLRDALIALTNQTPTRLAFANSVLLWRTDTDRTEPEILLPSGNTLPATLGSRHRLPYVLWIDARWETIYPVLARRLKASLRPQADSDDAGHFERVNLAAAGLDDWELLKAVSLSTGSRILVKGWTVTLQHR